MVVERDDVRGDAPGGDTHDAGTAAGRRTILVVEDDSGDRAMIRRLLRDGGRVHELLEASTGEAGLELIRSARPDCVLLDYHLPDMDAAGFLGALGAGERSMLPVPVAIVTGSEDDASATAALQLGAQDYVVKDSVTASSLARVIENSIEKFQIRRELEESRAAMERQNQRLGALRDELSETVLELAGAARAKDRFLAVMSHEMRTPLNAILGYADLLDLELDGTLTDTQRHHLERMRVGSRHLLGLINDVLDLTRADAQKLEVDIRPVNAGAVIEEVTSLLDREASTKGVRLEVEGCDPSPPLVQADVQRLRQVLTNLVGNAIKFTDEGSVRVRCRPAGDGWLEIEVVDTGIGIDAEELPLVFNEFYQARGELTRPHGGSGLGLSIAQRLARLMGGEIRVRSETGKGSTFTLRLRLAAAESEPRAEDAVRHDEQMAAHAASRQPRATTASVSVVAFGRDRDALAELQKRVSRSARLAWTTDPEHLIELARSERASLVVLDVGTGGEAAWQAAHAMHGSVELSSTPVLLLPSLSTAIPQEGSQVLDLGLVSLVSKPFTAVQLRQAVATATGSLPDRAAPGDDSPFTVLVVDDDPDSRRVAARFLEQEELHVREAPDGERALMAMRESPPDVVVLDLMMPVLDGFGVLAAMRADAQLAPIPAVVLTAKTLTDAERAFLSRTAVQVLQKGEHRLADVASLVLRAAFGQQRRIGSEAAGGSAVP